MSVPDADLPAAVVVGIDATQYLQAPLGLARYLGSYLMDLAKHPFISPLMIAPEPLFETLTRRFSSTPVEVVEPADVRKNALDLVWYPWGTATFPTDAPSILSLHDSGAFAKSLHENWRQLPQTLGERHKLERAVRAAERIFAPSQYSKQKFAKDIDIDLAAIDVISTLPDASWAPGPQELTPAELGDMPFVLCVAGWKKHHDVDFIMHCFEREFRREELTLVICGELDEKQRARLEALPHSLQLPGKLDDKTLRSLYRNAATVVHPAPKSHWSQTLAEALCCGAPVIAADGGSAAEIVGEAGFLLSLDDLRGWCNTLRQTVFDQTLNTDLRSSAIAAWGNRNRRTSFELLTQTIFSLTQSAPTDAENEDEPESIYV